jgi:hypothetical protein
LSFHPFSFGHCIVCPSLIYGFWLPFWYLITLLHKPNNKHVYLTFFVICSHKKTKDRVTRTPLKSMGELRCSGRVRSSCSTSGARRFTLVTILVISHEWGKDHEVFTKSATYPWSFVTQMLFEHIRRSSTYDIDFSWN